MRVVTYSELYSGVCRMANVLKAQRVGIGETVALDLPPSPEAVCALLACARIGAVATSVDAATTPAALAIRLQETRARVILSDDSKVARADLPDTLTSVVWIGPPDAAPASARTVQYSLAAEGVSDECEPEDTAARDPLAALDDPHGRIATGGFLVWSLVTHETLFATGPGTITCCTAPTISPIWLAHGVLGPLLHGGTIFLTSATGARLRQTCDTHGVSTLCAPASGLGDAVPATDTRRPTRLVAVMDHAPTRGSQASHATRLPQDAIRTLEVPGAGLFATVTGSSIVLPMPGVGIDLDSGSAPAGAGPAEGWVSLRHWPGAIDKAVHPLPSEFRWLARRDSEGRIGLSPA